MAAQEDFSLLGNLQTTCLKSVVDYEAIWKKLRQPATATKAVEELVGLIRLLDKKPEKDKNVLHIVNQVKGFLGSTVAPADSLRLAVARKKKLTTLLFTAHLRQATLATLLILSLVAETDCSRESTRNELLKWTGALSEGSDYGMLAKEITNFLITPNLSADIVVRSLLHHCLSISSFHGMAAPLPDLRNRLLSSSTLCLGYAFEFILGTATEEVLRILIASLRYSDMSQQRILCVLHVMIVAISRSPICDRSLLEEALGAVKPFLTWPLPYGAMVKEVLDLLVKEIRSPGCALRDNLGFASSGSLKAASNEQTSDSNVGTEKDEDAENEETAASSIVPITRFSLHGSENKNKSKLSVWSHHPNGKGQNEVHLLVNPYARQGQVFEKVFKDEVKKAEQLFQEGGDENIRSLSEIAVALPSSVAEKALPHHNREVLWYFLHLTLGDIVDEDALKAVPLAIIHSSLQEVVKVYRLAETEATAENGRDMRLSGVRRVYENLLRTVTQGDLEETKNTRWKGKKHSTFLRPSFCARESTSKAVEGKRSKESRGSEEVTPLPPPLPCPLVVKMLPWASPEASLLHQTMHVLDSAVFLQAERFGQKRYVRFSGSEAFETAVLTSQVHAMHFGEGDRFTFQLCLGGGDGTVLAFLADLVVAYERKPDLMKNMSLEVFLLPLGENNYLSSFLAIYDGWYCANVFSSLSSPLPQLPHINPWDGTEGQRENGIGASPSPLSSAERSASSTSNAEARGSLEGEGGAADGLSSPLQLLRRQVRTYIRDARHTTRIVIFECEFYCVRKGTSDLFLNCTIPFCQRAEVVNQTDQNGRKLTLTEEKGKASPSLLSLELEYTEMNPVGVLRQKPVKELRNCSMLHFSNVPREKERTVCPQPSLEALEMVVSTPDLSKRRKTKLPGASLADLSGIDRKCYHVISAQVTSPDQQGMFEVVLDGERFGPASMIKIRPAKDINDNVIHFPVQTFLPIDL